ncbi:hypothetical protein GCM10023217_10880 [Gordonia alkaliphila]|uniref:Uncharacterized protein n=1 Tax=Gordonia alkaliphila TaxID=1053547 RepID=A0ABP8Z1P7_9ACTN
MGAKYRASGLGGSASTGAIYLSRSHDADADADDAVADADRARSADDYCDNHRWSGAKCPRADGYSGAGR